MNLTPSGSHRRLSEESRDKKLHPSDLSALMSVSVRILKNNREKKSMVATGILRESASTKFPVVTGLRRLSQNSESRRNRATLLVPRLRLGMHDLEAPPPL